MGRDRVIRTDGTPKYNSKRRKPRVTVSPTRGLPSVATEHVNHPLHYGGRDDPYEVIKVLEHWLTREEFLGALKFNILKYTARARKKNGAEDHAKAAWYAAYLKDYLARTGGEEG